MFVKVEGVCVGMDLHYAVNRAGSVLDEQKDTSVEEPRLHVGSSLRSVHRLLDRLVELFHSLFPG